MLGKTTQDINAADVIWDFLSTSNSDKMTRSG